MKQYLEYIAGAALVAVIAMQHLDLRQAQTDLTEERDMVQVFKRSMDDKDQLMNSITVCTNTPNIKRCINDLLRTP